jgi:hypothetical protein
MEGTMEGVVDGEERMICWGNRKVLMMDHWQA